jgi:hypothetical protein
MGTFLLIIVAILFIAGLVKGNKQNPAEGQTDKYNSGSLPQQAPSNALPASLPQQAPSKALSASLPQQAPRIISRQAIQAYATTIKVPFLLHFTRAVNLTSIISRGLYPVGRAHEVGANPCINDQYRWDGHRDATSISIGFPNYRMFYKYRVDEPAVDWAVLVIEPSILWEKNCAFCRHNAADKRIRNQLLSNLMTPQSFMGMYDRIEGFPPREEQNLRIYDPTDVQAEVLVFDAIEPQFIAGIIFEEAAVRDTHLPRFDRQKTCINKGMFGSREYARTRGDYASPE